MLGEILDKIVRRPGFFGSCDILVVLAQHIRPSGTQSLHRGLQKSQYDLLSSDRKVAPMGASAITALLSSAIRYSSDHCL